MLVVVVTLLLRQCRISNEWEIARERFGENLPISEVLVAKRFFEGSATVIRGCTYSIVRFDDETAASLRKGNLQELISSLNYPRAKFPTVEEWQSTPSDMKELELWPDLLECLAELPATVATEMRSSFESSGSWVYARGGRGRSFLMLLNLNTRLAAVIRYGD